MSSDIVPATPSVSPCRRVHISEATKSKLVGEFELEDGNGADRDPLLKGCAMKTYLVVDRRLPRVSGRLRVVWCVVCVGWCGVRGWVGKWEFVEHV